jgi:hypothetical protein
MIERNLLAVDFLCHYGKDNSKPPAEETQQIPSVFATGGLTQKQSLRGLLLRHLMKIKQV